MGTLNEQAGGDHNPPLAPPKASRLDPDAIVVHNYWRLEH
jgi:hypothetical protein